MNTYFYLEINHQGSERLTRKAIEDFNKKLDPNDFKKKSLKQVHLNTLLMIERMQQSHLQAQKYGNLEIDQKAGEPFKINNVALARMIGCKISVNKKTGEKYSTTAYRHLKRLSDPDVNLIQKGTAPWAKDKTENELQWHGTRSSFELRINPAIHVVDKHLEFTENLLTTCELLLKRSGLLQENEKLPNNITEKAISLTPSFLDFPNGIVTSCNDIATQILLNLNINICGVTSQQISDDINVIPNHLPNHESKSIQGIIFAPDHTHVPYAIEKTKKQNEHSEIDKKLERYTEWAWKCANAILWKNEVWDPFQIEKAKNDIAYWFLPNREKYHNNSFEISANIFIERILLQRQTYEKSPYRFYRNAWTYFDKNTKPEGSFKMSKEWYANTRNQRKINKNFNIKNRIFAEEFIKYMKNAGNTEAYRISRQRIGKLNDSNLNDKFYQCVLTPEYFNHKNFKSNVA